MSSWIPSPPQALCLALPILAGAAVAAWHFRARRQWKREAEEVRNRFAQQMEERGRAEENLRRTVAMFQLTLDVAAAAGSAQSLDEALQSGLDIVCTYTGWPVGHALRLEERPEGGHHLAPCGVWHLEDPHDHEAFLRRSEHQSLGQSKGLPGRAWTTGRIAWAQYADGAGTPFAGGASEDRLKLRALEAGLTFGIAIPVFHEEDLVAVLEFFSPPIPDPNPTVLEALTAAGEQLGRVVERLQAQELMERMNRQLVELHEEKNQFLAIASHDLKNPLNTIALLAETLLVPECPEEKREAMARSILEEAHRSSQLIQRLLDVSAIESGKFQMNPREISLVDAMVRIQSVLQGRAEAKGQAIHMDLPEEDIVVVADAECLHQVLENLVGNALKFMPQGPPIHTVHLSCRAEGDRGVLEIRDEGPGFSEEDLAKAFGRFTRLRARPTGGETSTGLGLSIVRKLTRAMHGEAELESQLGRGATFRISLPLVPSPEGPSSH